MSPPTVSLLKINGVHDMGVALCEQVKCSRVAACGQLSALALIYAVHVSTKQSYG